MNLHIYIMYDHKETANTRNNILDISKYITTKQYIISLSTAYYI